MRLSVLPLIHLSSLFSYPLPHLSYLLYLRLLYLFHFFSLPKILFTSFFVFVFFCLIFCPSRYSLGIISSRILPFLSKLGQVHFPSSPLSTPCVCSLFLYGILSFPLSFLSSLYFGFWNSLHVKESLSFSDYLSLSRTADTWSFCL